MRLKILHYVLVYHSVGYCSNVLRLETLLFHWKWTLKLPYYFQIVACTIENAISEKASLKVAWCTEHFSLWWLECFENPATLNVAKPGQNCPLCHGRHLILKEKVAESFNSFIFFIKALFVIQLFYKKLWRN